MVLKNRYLIFFLISIILLLSFGINDDYIKYGLNFNISENKNRIKYGVRQSGKKIGKWVVRNKGGYVLEKFYSSDCKKDSCLKKERYIYGNDSSLTVHYHGSGFRDFALSSKLNIDDFPINDKHYFPVNKQSIGEHLFISNCNSCHVFYNKGSDAPFVKESIRLHDQDSLKVFLKEGPVFTINSNEIVHPSFYHFDQFEVDSIVSFLKNSGF